MDGNIKAWRANRAMAWLYAVLLLVVGGYVFIGRQPVPMRLLFAPTTIMVAMLLFHAFTARACRLRRPWARLASLLAGFVLLFGFPIGTIVGVYLIGACWSPWPEAFTNAGAASGAWPSNAVRDHPRVTGR